MGSSDVEGPSTGAVMGHHRGPVTLSDGVNQSLHAVEIHSSPRENVNVAAWQVIIRGRLPVELRTPDGRAFTVILPGGTLGVGTLVYPLTTWTRQLRTTPPDMLGRPTSPE
jgi:hypothetical protein